MNFRLLLLPLGWLFSSLVWLRNQLYDSGILRSQSVPSLVICIGNITAGGTGKTPWVQWLSRRLGQLNHSHAILSRGYSGDFSGVLEVLPDMDPRKCGDEPLWLKRNTDTDVFIGSSRVAVAGQALEKNNYKVLVLDDGFQHRALRRDIDIVLLDASAPASMDHPLPAGLMREGFSGLRRADYVIINKCNHADPERVRKLSDIALQHKRPDQIFKADFIFSEWAPLLPGLNQDLDKSAVCLSCGVGNPKAFEKTVEAEGIKAKRSFIFPDHYFWKPVDIEKMTYHMQQIQSSDLVITEKDAVKLIRYKKHFTEMGIQLWVCKMRVDIHGGDEVFAATLQQSIDSRLS